LDGEESEFRIDGGGIGAELGHESFGGEKGGIFSNFQRNTADENHDPDGVVLGLLDGDGSLESENGVGEKVFGTFKPAARGENFFEGEADFRIVLGAGNFLREGSIESKNAIGGDGAGFGVEFGEGLRIGIGAIEDNDGVGGEVGGGGIWVGGEGEAKSQG